MQRCIRQLCIPFLEGLARSGHSEWGREREAHSLWPDPFCSRVVASVDRLTPAWEGYHESRRCSRDTYPESYITKYTSTRRETLHPHFFEKFETCQTNYQPKAATQDCKSDLPMRPIAVFGDRKSSQVNIRVGPYGRKPVGT